MRRTVLDDDHLALVYSSGRLLDTEVVDHSDPWTDAGHVPREVLGRLGELGFLGLAVPEALGDKRGR